MYNRSPFWWPRPEATDPVTRLRWMVDGKTPTGLETLVVGVYRCPFHGFGFFPGARSGHIILILILILLIRFCLPSLPCPALTCLARVP